MKFLKVLTKLTQTNPLNAAQKLEGTAGNEMEIDLGQREGDTSSQREFKEVSYPVQLHRTFTAIVVLSP